MEDQNELKEQGWEDYKGTRSKSGRILSGFVLIGAGVLFFAKQMGFPFPSWLFTWPVFLIGLGLYIGAKHMFRNPGWLVMVIIGSVFLTGDLYPDLNISDYLLPIFLIMAGLVVVFKPFKPYKYKGRFRHHQRMRRLREEMYGRGHSNPFVDTCAEETSEDMLDTVAIFGGVKKSVLSKNFKGGEVVCVMGGAEINLIHADIQGVVELEMVQVFGGAKLIIPANWEIRSEAVVILGGIEDKRHAVSDNTVDAKKVLLIRGTCIFGGIDIRSY